MRVLKTRKSFSFRNAGVLQKSSSTYLIKKTKKKRKRKHKSHASDLFLEYFFSVNTMKRGLILSIMYRVCFAIVCLNIGTKLISNKRIILLFGIQGDLSKTCNMQGFQEEITYTDTAGALFYAPFCPKYAPSCILPSSQKQPVQETLINLIILS